MIRLANKDDTEAIAYVISTAQKTWVTWANDELQLYDVAQLSEQWSQRIDNLTTISFVYTDAHSHVVRGVLAVVVLIAVAEILVPRTLTR